MPAPPTLVDFQKIVVAAQPTPGMGLALDYNGKIPSLKKLLGCDYGQAILTYPGGSVSSNTLTVTHLIGAVPSSVLITNTANVGVNLVPAGAAFTITSTNFMLFCNTVDGQLPALNSTSTFYWFAIA